MDYARVHWSAVTGLGGLLLVRHLPALVGPAPMAGNLPPILGVLAGFGVLAAGARALYLGAESPDRFTPVVGVVLLLFVLQGVAVVAWLAGAGWN